MADERQCLTGLRFSNARASRRDRSRRTCVCFPFKPGSFAASSFAVAAVTSDGVGVLGIPRLSLPRADSRPRVIAGRCPDRLQVAASA